MQSKQIKAPLLLLGIGLLILFLGPSISSAWKSWVDTNRQIREASDEASEKLKDFFLDEKEPYHPDRPVANDEPEPVKEIIVFSASWCEPCQRWERTEKPKFKAIGYKFAEATPAAVSAVGRIPHFIVTDGTKTVEISGYMTPERLESELRK
jgi:hypothetical protein